MLAPGNLTKAVTWGARLRSDGFGRGVFRNGAEGSWEGRM